MPTSVSLGPALYMDGPSFDASVFRFMDAAALAYNGASYGGVYQNLGRMTVAAQSGMNVTVDVGTAIIPSAAGTTDGAYRVTNNQQRVLTATTADPTNPRIDLVCAGVQENSNSTSFGFVEIVAGTPAPSPAPPSTPPNSIPLAQVLVNANASSITSGNITDARTFQCAPGGILPVSSTGAAPQGVNGQFSYDIANDRIFHMAASGPRQARVLPWVPVQVVGTSNVTNTGSETTVLTASVTTDGSTDIEIMIKWRGILVASAGGLGLRATMILKIGSTQVDDLQAYNPFNDGSSRAGGVLIHQTSSALGDTPSAGTHTVKWSFTETYSGTAHVQVDGNSTSPLVLRVRPVIL
jgi:hypothetical protein